MSFDFKKELWQRFERYVMMDTQSDENSKTYPSTPNQLKLGKKLAEELKALGLKNVGIDKFGYVTAEIPATVKKKLPVIGFLAHMDTAPDASGSGVKPQVHANYRGGDIMISKPAGMILSPKDSPELLECVGEDIVTASGDTLLGADNKAGIAIIMAAARWLVENPSVPHGKVKIAFTPDEEIGRGVDHFDVKKFGADYAYTVDSDTTGVIEDETFNADGVVITVKGKSYHPGLSKNLMANAVRIAADIMNSWPENMLPETTEKREGFIMFTSCQSGIEEAVIKGIVREHDIKKLARQEKLLGAIVEEKRLKYPASEIKMEFTRQYRNMKEVIDRHPEVMKRLVAAMKAEGVEPRLKPIRGGTDGARLSFMGLPTPNIFVGGGNFHGKYEWVSLDGMAKASRVVTALVREWGKNS